jgi:DNA polymerase-3 subunit alpha (Gram-positive type)
MSNNIVIVYDTETLGLKIGEHEVVDLGAVMLQGEYPNQKIVSTFQSYIKPDHPEKASPEAMKVNGLDLEELAKAPSKLEVYHSFKNWINEASQFTPEIVETVCCNKCFDVPRVELDMENLGLPLPWNFRLRWDVKDMARVFAPGINNSLYGLCKHFRVKYDKAHSALDDARMTAEVWMKMEKLRYMFFNNIVNKG